MKKGARMDEAAKAKRREAAARQWTPEARAAASARAKERAAGKSSSASPPSKSSGASSSLPPSLPPSPALASVESASNSDRLLTTLLEKLEAATGTKEATEATRPELPIDDAEREAALRPARWPARVPVVAVSELCRVFGLDVLSDEEREEGRNAFAVLFWQLGLYRDGRVLVALWLFGVAAPRSASVVKRRLEARNEKKAGA